MKKLISILALTLSAFAMADSENPALYASWTATVAVSGPLQVQLTLSFAKDGLTATSTCTKNGQSASISTSGDYNATMDTITITSNSKKSTVQNGITCNVAINATAMSYKIKDDMLTLTMSDDTTLTLTKVN